MDTISRFNAEERWLGRWPRRLLHVPTMTSLEWQPGNKYGSVVEPSYNVISYTWGRWRLEDGEMSDHTAIEIGGIPWDVPRVHPMHFSPSQLLAVIRRASGETTNSGHPPSVEFVWIDIACIDQREAEPGCSAEVGRQAGIFQGAKHVFAWLSSLPGREVGLLLHDLQPLLLSDRSPGSACERQPQTLPDDAFSRVYACFPRLLADPWFSSLWTLQEAFLRSDAVILSREGTTIPLVDSVAWSIVDVARCAVSLLHDTCRDTNLNRPNTMEYHQQNLKHLVNISGLRAVLTANPLALFAASQSRHAATPEERIYGIQQIFDIRVGVSSTPYPHMYPYMYMYTAEQLHVQFGEQLVARYPILSQMHIFTDPAPVGTAWLVSTTGRSKVPPGLPSRLRLDDASMSKSRWRTRRHACGAPPREVALSVRRAGRNTWGWFDGLVCSFSALHAACQEVHVAANRKRNTQVHVSTTLLTIHLDAPAVTTTATASTRTDSESQRRLAKYLLQPPRKRGERNEVEVLRLGPSHSCRRAQSTAHDSSSSSSSSSSISMWERSILGLLLVRRDEGHGTPFPYYRRIGICWWDVVDAGLSRGAEAVLRGKGGTWQRKSDLFG